MLSFVHGVRLVRLPRRREKYNPNHEPAGSSVGGQFAPADGGDSASGTLGEGGVPSAEYVSGIIHDVQKDLGYSGPTLIDTNEAQHFTVAGQEYKTAGTANLQTGVITLYTDGLAWNTRDQIAGVMAHEIEHEQFQRALNAADKEFQDLMARYPPGGANDIMLADGTLKSPYDKEFPNYQDMAKYWHLPTGDSFRQGDGVSAYSIGWWIAQQKNEATYVQAVHETLAEMSKAKYETGKLPEHRGFDLLRFRPIIDGEPGPRQSQAEQDRLTKQWRDLYKAIERVNERLAK